MRAGRHPTWDGGWALPSRGARPHDPVSAQADPGKPALAPYARPGSRGRKQRGGQFACLTASEVFPLEIRGLAIAIFFAVGTGTGGVLAPWLFATLIGTGFRVAMFYGYRAGAGLMLIAVAAVLVFGVRAERKPLEEISPPLSTEDASA